MSKQIPHRLLVFLKWKECSFAVELGPKPKAHLEVRGWVVSCFKLERFLCQTSGHWASAPESPAESKAVMFPSPWKKTSFDFSSTQLFPSQDLSDCLHCNRASPLRLHYSFWKTGSMKEDKSQILKQKMSPFLWPDSMKIVFSLLTLYSARHSIQTHTLTCKHTKSPTPKQNTGRNTLKMYV